MDFFVVNLKKGTTKKKLLLGCIADGFEYMSEASWNYAHKAFIVGNSNHRVSLSASCLSIGEHSAVIAL